MTTRLINRNVGALKSVKPRRKIGKLSEIDVDQQISEEQKFLNVPIVRSLYSQIPELKPYLNPTLFPDILDMYWRGGIKYLVNYINLTAEDRELKLLIDNLTNIVENEGIDRLKLEITKIKPDVTETQLSEIDFLIIQGAKADLVKAIGFADPNNPVSIIFNHPSQKFNRETYKIEIDMILNEPEVEERTDMQCECGSRKIQAIPVQMRGADEPPTILARCVVCKTKWRTSAA